MAYQLDFTASNYVNRSRRKTFLRLLLLAAVGGTAWGVYDVYKTYNEPTLNMRLAEYEAVARPIEEINKAWDETEKEFNSMLRYYRLVWSANPTNFLDAMVSTNAPRLGRGFHLQNWTLKTGGDCTLGYSYVFEPGDKAEQAKGLEAKVVNAVTSVVMVVDGMVDVQGVQLENLLNVSNLDITAKFSLPNARSFPAKESTISDCVSEIVAMRKKVQEAKFMKVVDAKGDPTTALALMTKPYIEIGRDAEGLPNHKDAIDIMGWLRNADRFIESTVGKTGKKVPVSDVERRQHLKDVWNKIGEARFPWDRFRVLDNDEIVARTKAMGIVSDGVKRFKGFLDQRNADCKKKLEPFINAYERNDVFNEPLIESDLKDRVAKAAGITSVTVSFKDEPDSEPAILDKDDEKFAFTWVRWTLSLGGDLGTGNEGVLTLEKLVDCVRRVLELGPGYVLDKVKVEFGEDGNVSEAVLDGLLPVKKTEKTKEEAGNVD